MPGRITCSRKAFRSAGIVPCHSGNTYPRCGVINGGCRDWISLLANLPPLGLPSSPSWLRKRNQRGSSPWNCGNRVPDCRKLASPTAGAARTRRTLEEYTLEQFSTKCHRILKQDAGVEGRKKACALIQQVLKDDALIASNPSDDVPERKVLYEDPELGFCILGHVHHDAKGKNPHDHGPSWAIYGQARGETIMTDYFPVARPSEGHPGKARSVRNYKLTPGMAYSTTKGTCIGRGAIARPASFASEARTWKR